MCTCVLVATILLFCGGVVGSATCRSVLMCTTLVFCLLVVVCVTTTTTIDLCIPQSMVVNANWSTPQRQMLHANKSTPLGQRQSTQGSMGH